MFTLRLFLVMTMINFQVFSAASDDVGTNYPSADSQTDVVISDKRFVEGKKTLKRRKREVTEELIPLQNAFVINDYKTFLRKESANKSQRKKIMEFYDELENSAAVRSFYSAISLVKEFESVEEQSYNSQKAHQEIDFYPIYRYLLNRISAYAEKPKAEEQSPEYKKLYSYLYTTTLSKMHILRNNTQPDLIIDIASYMHLTNKKFEELSQLQSDFNRVETIDRQNKIYKKSFENKIEEAVHFINEEITPVMDNIDTLLGQQIKQLVNETETHLGVATDEKDKAIKMKLLMEKNMVLGKIFSVLKVCTVMVSFVGPVGRAVGAVAGVGSSIAEAIMIDGEAGNQALTSIPAGLKTDLTQINEQMKSQNDKKLQDLNRKLDAVTDELNSIGTEDFVGPHKEISRIRSSLNELKTRNDYDPREIKLLNAQLTACLKKEEAELKAKSQKKDDKFAKYGERLETVTQFAEATTTAAVDIMNRVKNDKANLDAASKAVQDADKKLKELQDYEDQIYDMLIPMKNKMLRDVSKVADELENKSLVALDVKKWQVQAKLRDTKLYMRKFVAGFEVEDQLMRSVEKLEDVMTALINVYDRIESYQEQKHLADYLKDINSAVAKGITMSHPELNKAVQKLEIALKSNVVINEYYVTVNALKQWVFPFADYYFRDLQLPARVFDSSGARLKDVISLTGKMLKEVEYKMEQYKSAVHKHDKYIFSAEFNSKYTSSNPFFVWSNRQYPNEIARLLSGKQILLLADINSSDKDKDAIKFSALKFYFKVKNSYAQLKLNKILNNFKIRATHTGNSYYRFKDRVYVMNCESQSIEYSFEKNQATGEPNVMNSVYEKIKKGDLMLSPYTMWKIQLIRISDKPSFDDFNSFRNDISIELVGVGTYVGKYVEGSDDSDFSRYL